jgi:glutathione synthase/RimK-type ligase-like ATP-grasp enzyme
MILLWGTMDDEPLEMTAAALAQADADYVFLDHRKIFTSEIEYTFDFERVERCTVTANDTAIDMSAVNVAYVRGSDFNDYEEMHERPEDDPLAVRAVRFEMELKAWLDASDALVINRSRPSATNNSKPYQLAMIRQVGFAIPETLITNDAAAAQEFLLKNPDSVYKSVSGVRSVVRRVEEMQRSFIDDVRWCPTLFQSVVPGDNYRAHVVGSEVLAVRIESDQLDYRYGRTRMIATTLPVEVAQRCRRLTAMLGLHFSGIDLMQTPQGEWFCFEVNPSPGYPYFEMLGGQAIGASLARFMMEADAHPALGSLDLSPLSFPESTHELTTS